LQSTKDSGHELYSLKSKSKSNDILINKIKKISLKLNKIFKRIILLDLDNYKSSNLITKNLPVDNSCESEINQNLSDLKPNGSFLIKELYKFIIKNNNFEVLFLLAETHRTLNERKCLKVYDKCIKQIKTSDSANYIKIKWLKKAFESKAKYYKNNETDWFKISKTLLEGLKETKSQSLREYLLYSINKIK